MSTTVIAYTIIGSKVDRDDFFVHKERSVHEGCGDTGPGPYCMKCGQSLGMMKVDVVPVEGFEEEGGKHRQGCIGGLDIHSIDNGRTDHFLVAYEVESYPGWHDDGGPVRMWPEVDLDVCMNNVSSVLEPLGLWKPEDFGVWTALYYSS